MEEVVDLTLPDTDRIEKRAGDLLNQFKDMMYPSGYEPGAKVTKRKVSRSMIATTGSSPAKCCLEIMGRYMSWDWASYWDSS